MRKKKHGPHCLTTHIIANLANNTVNQPKVNLFTLGKSIFQSPQHHVHQQRQPPRWPTDPPHHRVGLSWKFFSLAASNSHAGDWWYHHEPLGLVLAKAFTPRTKNTTHQALSPEQVFCWAGRHCPSGFVPHECYGSSPWSTSPSRLAAGCSQGTQVVASQQHVTTTSTEQVYAKNIIFTYRVAENAIHAPG